MFKRFIIVVFILLVSYSLFRMSFVNKDGQAKHLSNNMVKDTVSAWVGTSHYQIPILFLNTKPHKIWCLHQNFLSNNPHKFSFRKSMQRRVGSLD